MILILIIIPSMSNLTFVWDVRDFRGPVGGSTARDDVSRSRDYGSHERDAPLSKVADDVRWFGSRLDRVDLEACKRCVSIQICIRFTLYQSHIVIIISHFKVKQVVFSARFGGLAEMADVSEEMTVLASHFEVSQRSRRNTLTKTTASRQTTQLQPIRFDVSIFQKAFGVKKS